MFCQELVIAMRDRYRKPKNHCQPAIIPKIGMLRSDGDTKCLDGECVRHSDEICICNYTQRYIYICNIYVHCIYIHTHMHLMIMFPALNIHNVNIQDSVNVQIEVYTYVSHIFNHIYVYIYTYIYIYTDICSIVRK